MSRRVGAVLAGGVVALALLLPAGASADHNGLNPPWPELLPSLPGPTDVQPQPVPHCRTPSIACVDQLVRRLEKRWRVLDRSCDHRAVPTLAYLRINQELRAELAKRESLFRHKPWFYSLLTTFSNRYFTAVKRYKQGKPVTESWQIAFDAWESGEITAGQEILLFSNAHVQHDLPEAYAEMGQRTRRGVSRKHDHDVFNEINNRILDPVGDEIAERYDPTFPLVDLKPLPADEIGSQEFVKVWRELAWRNGELLLAAQTPAERRQVEEMIDHEAAGWARLIVSFEVPGLRETRDAHCMAHG